MGREGRDCVGVDNETVWMIRGYHRSLGKFGFGWIFFLRGDGSRRGLRVTHMFWFGYSHSIKYGTLGNRVLSSLFFFSFFLSFAYFQFIRIHFE